MSKKITIDGREFDLDSLNEAARTQLGNIRLADQRMAQLKADLALTQTARSVYAKVLGENLPQDDDQPESKDDDKSEDE